MDQHIEELLRDLEHFGRKNDRMWNIPPETGRFLHMLVLATGAREVVEVGMSNGYSGIWIASALKVTGGKLATLEADPWKVELATENFAKAGLQDIIEVHHGDAQKTLQALEGPFDMAFLDASKDEYLEYLKLVEPKLRTHALVLADNAISHGEGMQDYLDYVERSEHLESVMVPIGSGEMMSVKVA